MSQPRQVRLIKNRGRLSVRDTCKATRQVALGVDHLEKADKHKGQPEGETINDDSRLRRDHGPA